MTRAVVLPDDRRALVAVDLGAESCRISLLHWRHGAPTIELIHRFANGPVRRADGTLRWPLQAIVDGAEHGMRLCAEASPEGIRAVAVDGWAVDYVRVDCKGQALDEPFCYRDERTVAAFDSLHQRIAPQRLQELTGVQLQRLNTLYQLHADRLAGLDPGHCWLNLPEYLLSRWGGRPVAEYTNATHTGMVELDNRVWSREITDAAGIALSTMPVLVPSGTQLGTLESPLASLPALRGAQLIAPACHDTASAVAGIPASGDDWAYISSGTWSLVGTVIAHSCNPPSVRADGFTNLGGVGDSICFHKNVNGLWLLKQCMVAWQQAGKPWELENLLEQAQHAAVPHGMLHVDDPQLLLMGDMPGRINAQLRARSLPPVAGESGNAPRMASLILHSLAARYQEVLAGVRLHTRKDLRSLFIVGGGSRNSMLRQLTHQATGLDVHAGSPESSTIGNLAIQLASLESTIATTEPPFREATAAWTALLTASPGMG